jgi:hypothetical protein
LRREDAEERAEEKRRRGSSLREKSKLEQIVRGTRPRNGKRREKTDNRIGRIAPSPYAYTKVLLQVRI